MLAFRSKLKSYGPWVVICVVLIITVFQLRSQGRLWICSCGRVQLWAGNVLSSDNSQHLFDPYSFTHMLHGFLACGVLAGLARKLDWRWRLTFAVAFEALWEIVENSNFIIERYRGETAALGYNGDTVVNSLGDVVAFAVGFVLARRLGWRWSLAIFLVTEAVLIVWIRDSLILNVIMLLYPISAIKRWQMGQ